MWIVIRFDLELSLYFRGYERLWSVSNPVCGVSRVASKEEKWNHVIGLDIGDEG